MRCYLCDYCPETDGAQVIAGKKNQVRVQNNIEVCDSCLSHIQMSVYGELPSPAEEGVIGGLFLGDDELATHVPADPQIPVETQPSTRETPIHEETTGAAHLETA